MDVLLNKCEKVYKDGEIRKLEGSEREIILNKNSSMADKALRVLAVAYLDIETLPREINSDTIEEKLIFSRINSE